MLAPWLLAFGSSILAAAGAPVRPTSDETIGVLGFMLFMLAMGYLIWQIYSTYQQHWHYEQKLQFQLVTGQPNT